MASPQILSALPILGGATAGGAGFANYIPILNESGLLDLSFFPSSIVGDLQYQGTWNASTNTPTLASSVGTQGFYYIVSVAGNAVLDGETNWFPGDWVIFSGTVWNKLDANTTQVISVAGRTGAVTLTSADLTDATTAGKAAITASNSTGTNYVVFNNSPSFITPNLGVATATSINGLTITTSTGTLTVANGKTAYIGNSLNFSGSDGASLNIGAGGTLGTGAFNPIYSLPPATSLALGGVIIGNGLNINSGTVSVAVLGSAGLRYNSGSGADTTATSSQLQTIIGGGVYQAPISLTTTGSGVATFSGNVLNIPNTTYTLPNATTSTLGGVIVGNGLNVTTGTVSVAYGTTANTALQGSLLGANSGVASLTVGGILTTSQFPALTGDVTNTAGSLSTTVGKINGTSLASLASGLLYNTTTTGVPSIATSNQIQTVIGSNVYQSYNANTTTLGNTTTGSGNIVLATSPSLTTPNIGAATATSVNSLTITTSTGTLSITNGKTVTVNNTLTFSGTDSSTLNIGTGGTLNTGAFTAAYTLPNSTTSTLGGVIVGNGLNVTTGTVSVAYGTISNTALQGSTLGAASGVASLTAGSLLTTAQFPALTGDVTNTAGSLSTTVGKINGTSLSGLASGVLYNTTTTGVPSIATSSQIQTAIGSNVYNAYNANTTTLGNTTTGSGNIVLATSPSLTTPNIGAATGTSLTLTSTSVAPLTVDYTGTISATGIFLEAPNLATGSEAAINIGLSTTTNNRVLFQFYNNGGAGSSLNCGSLILQGATNGLYVFGSGHISNTSTDGGSALNITGSLSASSNITTTGGAFVTQFTTGVSSFTLTPGFNTSTGSNSSQTVTLPAPASGQLVIFKNAGSQTWTVASNSGSQIEATGAITATATTTVTSGTCVRFSSDGTYWFEW